jgi:integrase
VRYLAALSHAFTIAMKEYGWIDDSPLRRVTKPKEPRGRMRFLDHDERERLLKVCQESDNPYLHTIVVLAIATGMRYSEILNLKWKDVNFNKSWVILHETKNGETRQVPLPEHALELLERHDKVRSIDTHYLFPGKDRKKPIDIRTAWETALKKSNIADFRFHDLRHTCASYLAMNGASLADIAAILGHKTLAMVKRYAHLSETHISNVVSRMNEKIFG